MFKGFRYWQLEAAGAFLVLLSFGLEVFMVGRASDFEERARDVVLVTEIQLSQDWLEESARAELTTRRGEARELLRDSRELTSNISLLAAYVFALGSVLTILGFILEKRRESL